MPNSPTVRLTVFGRVKQHSGYAQSALMALLYEPICCEMPKICPRVCPRGHVEKRLKTPRDEYEERIAEKAAAVSTQKRTSIPKQLLIKLKPPPRTPRTPRRGAYLTALSASAGSASTATRPAEPALSSPKGRRASAAVFFQGDPGPGALLNLPRQQSEPAPPPDQTCARPGVAGPVAASSYLSWS